MVYLKTKLITLIASLLLLAPTFLVAQECSAMNVRYHLTDLGTANDTASLAVGINDFGQIIGMAHIKRPEARTQISSFLWRHGIRTFLHNSRSRIDVALAINNKQTIIGYSSIDGVDCAVEWKDGTPHRLINNGIAFCQLYSINNRDEGVGVANISGRIDQACLWRKGKLFKLGSLGSSSGAYSINDRQQIVGYSITKSDGGDDECHAVLWYNGIITTLDCAQVAYGINNRGQVVGAPGFLWQNGKIASIGALQGRNTIAYAINDFSQVVGEDSSAGSGPHAFLWQTGVMTDLNGVVDVSGWELTDARSINRYGQIVGSGLYAGKRHAYLLSPVHVKPDVVLSGPDRVHQSNTFEPATSAEKSSLDTTTKSVTSHTPFRWEETMSRSQDVSGVEFRAICQSICVMPSLVRAKTGQPVFLDQSDFHGNVAPHDGQTQVYLALRLVNRSDHTLYFRLWDTFIPHVWSLPSTELFYNYSRPPRSFGLGLSPPISPGHSFLLTRPAKLVWTDSGCSLVCATPPGGVTVSYLTRGKYAIKLEYRNDYEQIDGHNLWRGSLLTLPVNVEIK